MFSLYLNPNLDDRIFYCLLASMATLQAEDIRASFLFVGDPNGHLRSGWVLPPRTVMELQPLSSQLSQLVVGPTHARGGTLDLLMTDASDLVRVAVEAPIGNSDHSSLSAVISMAQTFQTCVLAGKFS